MNDNEPRNQASQAQGPEDDFNPTITVQKPEPTMRTIDVPQHHKAAASAPATTSKLIELEDIIGNNNISRFTSAQPDTTAHLDAPLNNLSTRYSVLEEFAQGGNATVSIAQDKNLRRIVAIKSLSGDA